MPEKIYVNEDRGIIEVRSYGVISKEDIAGSISKARQLLEEKGLNKILVDTTGQETMPNTMGILDLFSGFPREFRLALLVQASQATAEDIRFAETVGVNRGVLVQIFDAREKALQWFKQGSVKQSPGGGIPEAAHED